MTDSEINTKNNSSNIEFNLDDDNRTAVKSLTLNKIFKKNKNVVSFFCK